MTPLNRRTKQSRALSLAALAERIHAVECKHAGGPAESIATGLPPPLASLDRGVVHEWFCPCDRRHAWSAPILALAHLAARSLHQSESSGAGLLIWIGRRVWPQPHVLVNSSPDRARPAMLSQSLFINPSSESDRLWAIDLCARSPAVAAVVADGSGITLAQSRRLQLAAEAGASLMLLARPAHELSILSAAATRWRVEHVASRTARPRWNVSLVRCKGVQRRSGMDATASLILEHHRATGCVGLPAELADRSVQAAMRRAG